MYVDGLLCCHHTHHHLSFLTQNIVARATPYSLTPTLAMEQPAVHAVTPPPDVLSPSLVASAVASPVTVEVDADGEAEAEDDTGADAWLTGTDLPDLPAESAPPSTLSASVSAGASASTAAPAPAPTPAVAPAPPTPVDDLLPLPTSFDPDAPPPALAPVEIDDELAIKPKEADDADGIEAVEDPVAEVAEAVELPDMSGWIQDIQDLQDYGAADEVMAEPSAEAEAEAEARPPEPIEMSPLAELPQQLEDVPSLPALSESSSAAQARAANGNGTAAAAGEKRKGGALAGAESKRGKSELPRRFL
jgi:DNA polymerase-3 subunit gamma/tau